MAEIVPAVGGPLDGSRVAALSRRLTITTPPLVRASDHAEPIDAPIGWRDDVYELGDDGRYHWVPTCAGS